MSKAELGYICLAKFQKSILPIFQNEDKKFASDLTTCKFHMAF